MQYTYQRVIKALWGQVLFSLCMFSAVVSWSQTTQQFTGHVLDSTGAVIPEAQVVVHNQATGVDVKTVTTNSGDYTVPYLIPGTYAITASKAGFATVKKTDILLHTDQASTIDFQLGIGATSEVVTVNASAAQVELSKSDRGEIIDNERVQQMPLDSRNPYGLFSLSPGTHDFSSSQYPRPFDNVTGNQYVNGSPQVGQTNVDGVGNDVADAGRAAYVPPVDAVQEFKIVLNAYDASYGHSGGSAVDLSLKSGTNKFHGSAYEYMRRTWLDTKDFQSNYNGAPKAQHKRDQYGFEADGPVVIPHLINGQNKLFFLATYEKLKDILPNPSYNTYSIPNPAWLTGDFSTATYWNSVTNSLQPLTIYDPLTPLHTFVDPIDGKTKQAHSPFPGNIIPSNRIDPVATKILSYLSYLKPNVDPGAGFAPWTNNYQNLQVENDDWKNGAIKIDYNMSEKNMFSFRYSHQARSIFANWGVGAPKDDPANGNGQGTAPAAQTYAVQWTRVFNPNLLLNVGVSAMNFDNNQLEGSTLPYNMTEKLGFASDFYNQLTNNNHFLDISSNGLPNAKDFAELGASWLGYSGDRHALDFLPTLTYIDGPHTIRAGVNVNFSQWANPQGGNGNSLNFSSNFTGHYWNSSDAPGYTSGMSVASLLLGYPNSGTMNWDTHQFWSQHYFAPWIQDDWKIRRNLTLNIGLRWDFTTPETERHNKMNGVFNQGVLNPVSSMIPAGTAALGTNTNVQGGLTFAGVNGQSRGAYKMNMLDIQPRIGIAYALSNKMSIRGGIGESYISDQSGNGSDGFSSSASYTNSLDNGVTPYTATTGQGLGNPIPVVPKPSGASLGYLQDLGKSFSFFNPNYHIPALWSWSATYEIAPTRYDVFSVSYVGNRVPNNFVNANINQISPQWNAQCDVERGGDRQRCDGPAGQIVNPFQGIAGFSGTGYYSSGTISGSNFTRPYPEFSDITENGATSNGKSWYNALQAVGSHQLSRSLTLHATYTHAKAETSGGWVDQLNRVLARQVSTSNDVKHSITFSGVGILPFGRNRLLFSNANRFVDEIVNGWEIAPLYTYYSGFAWRPTDSGGPQGTPLYDTAGNWEMASTGGPINKSMGVSRTTLPPDGSHKDSRIRGVTPCVGYKDTDTGAIIPSPAATAAGCANIEFVRTPNSYAVGRSNIDFGVRQPGAYKFDMAASKNFSIPEGSKIFLGNQMNLQIRVDLLNAFNHPSWDEGYNNDPTSIDFGTIGKGPNGPTNAPRYLQLSARLSW
jgi:Carboxypeptidase regulatory-like domain